MYKPGTQIRVPYYEKYETPVYRAGDTVNAIGERHTARTLYYGNGSDITGRGDSVERYIKTATYENAYQKSGDSYKSIGTVYKIAGPYTYYQGNGPSGKLRGTSVAAVIHDGTLYEKGDEVTTIGSAPPYDMYYRYSQEDSTVTPCGGSVKLKLAEFTTREVTALTV